MSFKTRTQLSEHLLTHNKTKSFICNKCHSTFSRKSTLNTHELIHGGIIPYECPYCLRKFRKKSAFNYHIKRHFPNYDFNRSRNSNYLMIMHDNNKCNRIVKVINISFIKENKINNESTIKDNFKFIFINENNKNNNTIKSNENEEKIINTDKNLQFEEINSDLLSFSLRVNP